MRFYRPVIKEPVSTFVEAPLEFMQGVMEKDQASYNKADAVLKDQGKLLDQVVVHELYKEEKDRRVAEYQNALKKTTDELYSTGDVNKASRDLYNIQSQLSKDTYLKEAPAYSKVLWDAEKEIRENKDNVASYNNFFNPWMQKYSKNWRNPDGSIAAPNPGQLYEKNLDFQDKAKSMMADIKADGLMSDYDRYDPNLGAIINTKTGQKSITSDKVTKLAQRKAVDFLKTPEGTQFMRMTKEMYPDINNEQMINESVRYLFTAGSNQISTDITQGYGLNPVSDDYANRMGSNNNTNPWNAFEAVQVTEGTESKRSAFDRKEQIGSAFMITPSQEELDKNPKLKQEYNKFLQSNNGGYNTFNELSEGDKKIAMAYFDTKGYKASKDKFIKGESTQEELEKFYKDIKVFERDFMQKGFKQNLVKRNVGSVKQMNKVYSGFEQEEVPLTKFKEAGNLTASDKVWSFAENKMIPFSEIEAEKDDVAQVNAEFGYTSPLFTLSGGSAEWAKPKQLVVTKSNGDVEVYAIPDKGRPKNQMNVDAAIATNTTANYYPNVIVPSFNENSVKSASCCVCSPTYSL
jgi:hypothetical protein